MPLSSSRLATRLASASVTASIKALRRSDIVDAELVELDLHELPAILVEVSKPSA